MEKIGQRKTRPGANNRRTRSYYIKLIYHEAHSSLLPQSGHLVSSDSSLAPQYSQVSSPKAENLTLVQSGSWLMQEI